MQACTGVDAARFISRTTFTNFFIDSVKYKVDATWLLKLNRSKESEVHEHYEVYVGTFVQMLVRLLMFAYSNSLKNGEFKTSSCWTKSLQ